MAISAHHIHVEFLNIAVENKARSAEEGRPMFDDVAHCRIRWVGDTKRELLEPAHQKMEFARDLNRYITYAEKYPEHYRAFELRQSQDAVNGTPLSEAPFLTEAKREELRQIGVRTIEGLAQLEGANLARLGMYGREWKNKAQTYLDAAKSSVSTERYESEIAALKAQIAALAATGAQQQPTPPPAKTDNVVDDPFKGYSDADLKEMIRVRFPEQSLKGNFSRAKLVEILTPEEVDA